jgi:hypothetical protein
MDGWQAQLAGHRPSVTSLTGGHFDYHIINIHHDMSSVNNKPTVTEIVLVPARKIDGNLMDIETLHFSVCAI